MLIASQSTECLIDELENIIAQYYCHNDVFLDELSDALSKDGNGNLAYIVRELVNSKMSQ